MPKLIDLLQNTENAVSLIGDLIIKEAKQNLARGGKKGSYNASGKLTDSIKPVQTTEKGGVVESGIDMLLYGEFIDKGVKGVESGKSLANYKYTSKGGKQGLKGMPPPKAFDKWSIRRKIAPRDDKGRFLPRKSVNFGLAVSVFKYGIAPTMFLTKPFKKYTNNIATEVGEAFGEDTMKYITMILKDKK